MPMITVRYVTSQPRPNLHDDVAALAARLGAERLGKDPGVTAVLVEAAQPESWFIAGKHPTDAGLSAFWLDIKVTSGTNVKSDTTAFVAAAFEGMQKLLGPLHEESYVFVHAVDGDAYGYGGRTQNGRWAATHPGRPSSVRDESPTGAWPAGDDEERLPPADPRSVWEAAAACAPARTSLCRLAERRPDELGVGVLGERRDLAVLELEDIAVVVLIRFAVPRDVFAPGFHDDDVAFCNHAARVGLEGRRQNAAEGCDQIVQDGGLALIGPRPSGRARDRPAGISAKASRNGWPFPFAVSAKTYSNRARFEAKVGAVTVMVCSPVRPRHVRRPNAWR